MLSIPFVVLGCGPPPPGTKAGGGAAPVSIELATAEPRGSLTSQAVLDLAHRIERRSGGGIDVEIEWQAHRRATDAWSADATPIVADLVTSGEVDIAVTAEWVWIARGAPSLAALRTPFLIDRLEVLQEIAVGGTGKRMLADLTAHGVRGLALLPQGLRSPLSFGPAILEPDDLVGSSFRSLDRQGLSLFRGLGAEVPVVDGDDYTSRVARGEIDGVDASLVTASAQPEFGTITADVPYYPMSSVVVANSAWFESLAPDVRELVQAAATDTVRFVIDSTPSPAAAAEAYCAAGGAVVLAGEALAARWRAATAPARTALEHDPVTSESIAAIAALVARVPPEREPARACGGTAARPPGSGGHAPAAVFPEGVYRAEIPVSAFLEAGVDRQTAEGHAGIWTLTFRGGTWESTDPHAPVHDCPGSAYRVEGDRVVVVLGDRGSSCGGSAGRELFSARWEVDDGVVRFLDVRAGPGGGSDPFAQALFGSTDWSRVD